MLSHTVSGGGGGGYSSDSWALGCVLFFCLVGRPKYFGSSFQQVLQQIRADEAAGRGGQAGGEGGMGSTGGPQQQQQQQQASVHFSQAVSSTGSPEADDILQSLSPPTTELLRGLMHCDRHRRLSVADACAHAFFTQAPPLSSSPSRAEEEEGEGSNSGGGTDPRSFHLCEPVKLPRTAAAAGGGGGGEPARGEDRAWARRQCSMVWSPVLKTYDFQADTDRDTDGGAGAGAAGRLFAVLERERIVETAEEGGDGSWLP